MNLYHDPAACARPMCSLCRSHGEGYARGKDAAYSEIRARLTDDTHAPDCGCEPCLIVRAARSSGPARLRVRVLDEFKPPQAAPRYAPVEKLCGDCLAPFIAPPSDPDSEQCDIHRTFSRGSPRPFAAPREAM